MKNKITTLALLALLAGCPQRHETPPANSHEQHLRDEYCSYEPIDAGSTKQVEEYANTHHVSCK